MIYVYLNLIFMRKIEVKMNKYKVEITETLQKTIEVEADNKEDALHKLMKMYKNEEVILDDNDFVDLDFKNEYVKKFL